MSGCLADMLLAICDWQLAIGKYQNGRAEALPYTFDPRNS
jgi:hypothetical protein